MHRITNVGDGGVEQVVGWSLAHPMLLMSTSI